MTTLSIVPKSKRGPSNKPGKLDSLRREVQTFRATNNRLRADINSLVGERDTLKAELKALKSEYHQEQRRMRRLLEQARGLHPHIEHAPAPLRVAFEALYRDVVDICHEGADDLADPANTE